MIQHARKVEGRFRSGIVLAFLLGKSRNVVVNLIVGSGDLTHSCRSSQSFLYVRARASSLVSTFCCFFTYPLVMIISRPCRKKKKTRGFSPGAQFGDAMSPMIAPAAYPALVR